MRIVLALGNHSEAGIESDFLEVVLAEAFTRFLKIFIITRFMAHATVKTTLYWVTLNIIGDYRWIIGRS